MGRFIALEPESFAIVQIRKNRNRQPACTDAKPAKHASGHARTGAGKKLTAIVCEIGMSAHGVMIRAQNFLPVEPINESLRVWISLDQFGLFTRNSCNTNFVYYWGMKNVTITVEESALEWARIEAAKRNTSVSRLVGELLVEKMQREDAYARAEREWLADDVTFTSLVELNPRRAAICV